jgi:site-specific DNA recombinase
MKMTAIYARVSSQQQREEHTIASQTAALIGFAKTHNLEVPTEWVFEDEGFSGATLERPGLERVRDLAAEGQIQVVLAYSPDRLSRKYAYQILLIEELAKRGVETLFVNAPQGTSAEDQLLVQFQGMIAEYERAQILERSRRGKRHRARSGEVSVLSGAPYGYRYMRKTEETQAFYQVIDAEAHVVQRVYEMYTVDNLSIGEITRRLNAQGVATRKQSSRWERSVIWAMLRNPAYRGAASFGKTRVAGRVRVTRALRRRGGLVSSDSVGHERPREEWIEIPVPALISEESFARAQELLHENKIRSRRRTITPSIVQGLVSCQKCGYAFSRTSTCTSARKIHYYKCIGSESWRKLGGPVCDNGRFVRQDLLDQIVWTEVIRLLQDPTLIQKELDRRLLAARSSDPTKKREQSVQRELIRIGNNIERLLTAYQEDLLSLEQLRERMPSLRQREQALRAELRAIADQANDRANFLRLAETLSAFLARLRGAADTLDVMERQRIVRLIVKEILIGEDSIVIRHCIPVGLASPPDSGSSTLKRASNLPNGQNYLLRSGSNGRALRDAASAVLSFRRALLPSSIVGFFYGASQPHLDQMQYTGVHDASRERAHQIRVRDAAEVVRKVGIHHVQMAFVQRFFRVDHRLLGIAAHYPASSVIRASPSPHCAPTLPHGRPVARSLKHALGLPVLRAFSFAYMLPPLPRRSDWVPFCSIPQSYQPSPKGLPGRSAHRHFRGLLSVHSRCGLHTRAVTNS